jgi:hypothetical protein
MDKPTVSDFKTFFSRDFPFGTDPDKNVLDADVSKAFLQTDAKFNEDFFSTQNEFTLGYLYLSAHLLCMNLRASNAGFAGSFTWGTTSQSVGSVSVSTNLPGNIMNNPMWAWLVSTNYGVEYLIMILPELIAPFGIAAGGTKA